MLSRATVPTLLLALSGCGRLSFDPTGGVGNDALPGNDSQDGASAGNDDDGDGVLDSVDTCPHVPGPQLDSDGDGLGDLCDPHPTQNRDRFVLFVTFTPRDFVGQYTPMSGNWVVSDGDLVQSLPYADLLVTPGQSVDSIQVQVGFSIDSIVAGPAEQRQFAVHAGDDLMDEQLYGELNEIPTSAVNYLDIQHYTPPGTYVPAAAMDLASGIHTGEMTVTLTEDLTTNMVDFRGGWGNETYQVQAADPIYTGTSQIYINMNGLAVHLHYIFATTWTP